MQNIPREEKESFSGLEAWNLPERRFATKKIGKHKLSAWEEVCDKKVLNKKKSGGSRARKIKKRKEYNRSGFYRHRNGRRGRCRCWSWDDDNNDNNQNDDVIKTTKVFCFYSNTCLHMKPLGAVATLSWMCSRLCFKPVQYIIHGGPALKQDLKRRRLPLTCDHIDGHPNFSKHL